MKVCLFTNTADTQAVSFHSLVSWDVVLCSLVNSSYCFVGTSCIHIQGMIFYVVSRPIKDHYLNFHDCKILKWCKVM
jgi:hypothetical protein